MICSKCHTENREGIKFCEKCGAKMELQCPNCKAAIPLGKKFCGECGHRLAEATPLKEVPDTEPSGERKHVTVLFSDLSGYTAMSEKLDPEEVKDITTRVFREAANIVSRYEGFAEKYIGEAGVTHLEMGKRLNDHDHLKQAAAIVADIGADFDLAESQRLFHSLAERNAT